MMHNVTEPLHGKTVDRFNQEKLYIQLTRLFLDEIASGRWLLDERIPSEDHLCRQYKVSKITVRQAISNLVSDGYLIKIQGKGTYLTSVLPVVGLAMKTRFTEEMFGKEVKAEKEVLFQGVQEPSPEVRGYLKTDDDIFVIKTRRTVNGEPAYLDESMIPRGVLPDIETIDPTKTSLYSLLQERGTRKIFKVVQTIEIVKAGSGIAGHLDLEEGEQVLAVHRLLLSSDGSPVAYARLLGRADRYKFQAEFERIR